jgi:hypothetical protein
MFNFSFGETRRGLAAARTKPEGSRSPEASAVEAKMNRRRLTRTLRVVMDGISRGQEWLVKRVEFHWRGPPLHCGTKGLPATAIRKVPESPVQ